MVGTVQYVNGTLDSSERKQGPIKVHVVFSIIFAYDESLSVSAMIKRNNGVNGPTPHIAETSPRGHPDRRRGCLNPCTARWGGAMQPKLLGTGATLELNMNST